MRGVLFSDIGSISTAHQRDLLGEALANVLVSAGVIASDRQVTGPDLLLAAESYCDRHVWKPTHTHADGGDYRYLRLAPGKHPESLKWVAGVLYDAPDGFQRWTDEVRWKDRFTPIEAGR